MSVMPNKLITYSAIIALFIYAPSSLGADSLPQYAPVMKKTFQWTTRDKLGFTLPVALPNRGVFLAFGSIHTTDAAWEMVDLDKETISRFETTSQILPDGTPETILTSRKSRHLTKEEVSSIIEQANTVWRDEIEPPPNITSSFCDVVVLDGESVIDLKGVGCPAGNLVKAVGGLKLQ